MRNLDLDSFRRRNLSANAFPGQTQMPLPPERPSMVDVSVDDRPLNLPAAPENVISPTIGMNQTTPPVANIEQPTIEDQGPSTIGFGNLPASSGRDPFPNTMPMASQQPTSQNTVLGPYDSVRYDPRTRAMDMMYDMITSRPIRGETPLWRKIMAGFMAASHDPNTPQIMQQFQSAPYDKRLADWQGRWNNVKDLATLERYENVNQRYVTDYYLDAIRAAGSQDLQKRNLALKEYLALNPTMIKAEDRDGNLIMIDPRTATVHKTGSKAADFSDQEQVTYGLDPRSLAEARFEHEDLMNEIRQRDRIELKEIDKATQKEMEEIRQSNRVALQKIRAGDQLSLQERRNIARAKRTQSEEQLRREWINNYNMLINRSPQVRDLVELDAVTGYPRVKTIDEMRKALSPSFGGIFGGKPAPPDTELEKVRKNLLEYIFEMTQAPTPTGNDLIETPDKTTPKPSTNQAAPTATNKPRMLQLINPEGVRVGTIPEGTRVPEGFTTKE